MARIVSYVITLGVFIIVFILTDYIEGREISSRKRSDIDLKHLDESKGVQVKGDVRLPSVHIKVSRCTGKDCDIEIAEKLKRRHRHRHRHGRKHNPKHKKKPIEKKTKKKRRKNVHRNPSKVQISDFRDLMQKEWVPSDSRDLASYDQYYAGFGRRNFGRLQRPPEADRLERRLHPNLASVASNLIHSIDRVVMALKSNILEMHRTYDFAFNSTRYTIMMGVRRELTSIAETNDMVFDAVFDVFLVEKDLIMRAHQRGLYRPRTSTLDMPKFKPLTDDIATSDQERQLSERLFDKTQQTLDECNQQNSYLEQIKEKLESNTNRRQLLDLRRYINMTVGKLEAEFDTFMVMKKLERYSLTSGGSSWRDYQDAKRMMREARIALRTAAENSRGNAIAYEDWLRGQHGADEYSLAPVSFTDLRSVSGHGGHHRSKRATGRSPAEKARLRPIIDRVVRHASELRDLANRITRLLPPLIAEASSVTTGGGGGSFSYRVQASLLADKLVKDVLEIRFFLDRIRIAVNDEDELRKRCEEIELGSGDDGESTPIDCDDFDIGSGKEPDLIPTSIDKDNEESDFVFEGEKIPEKLPGTVVKRFGDRLKVHVITLKQNSDLTNVRAVTSGNKTHEMSARWTKARKNIDASDRFVTDANKFLIDFSQERSNIDRISERIKQVHEKVDFVSNITQSKTFQAVLKAEKKVAEVKGGKGPKSKTKDETSGSANPNSEYAAAFDAADKAKTAMKNMMTLTRVTPSLIAGVDQRVEHIRSNITSLRSKVDKARMVLASIQLSINKGEEGYIPIALPPSDESQSLHTSVEVCIKPKTGDGPILLATGNNAESYSLSMEDKAIKAKVFDNAGYDIGEVQSSVTIDAAKWYSIKMERYGDNLVLNVHPEGEEGVDKVEGKLKMSSSQPHPTNVFIGGAPDTLPMSLGSEVWQGCMGGLRVNGRSVGLLQKASGGSVPLPCDTHCTPSPSAPSLVFEGDGYMQFPADIPQLRYKIQSVNFEFRTRQENAFLISVVKGRFQLRAQLISGTLLIETTTPSEAIVLRSQNSKYNDGLFHSLRIVYRDSTTYPEIDGKDGQFSIESTRPERLRSPAEGILIGGMLTEHSDRIGQKMSSLIGCMRSLKINDKSLALTEVEKTEGVVTGSCSNHNMWMSCVEFLNTSSPIAYGTTQDANTVVLVITRGSTGPVLQYKKGDKFDAIIYLTTKGLEVAETVGSYEGFLPYSSDDNNTFITVTVKDGGSGTVTVSYQGQDVSFSYGSLWSGYGGSDPYTVMIGGQEAEDDKPLFTGGISQMIIGTQYLDMTKYIDDNSLTTCRRRSLTRPAPLETTESRRR